MEFKIIAPGGNELRMSHSPPADARFKLPFHESIGVNAYFGNMLFNNYKGNGFQIWFSNYDIHHQTELIGRMDVPVLELHIQFANGFTNNWDGLGEKLLKTYQYNLSFTPFVFNRVLFKPSNEYSTFDIHFELSYLEKLATHFSILGQFLEKVRKGQPADLSSIDRFLSPEMISIINQLLNCSFRNGVAQYYIESKVVELLLLILDHTSNTPSLKPIKLTPYDIECLHQAKELVLQDFENPLSLSDLSRKVAINEFKLKKGFKYLFGTTVFDYMHRVRMDKAKILLCDTKLSVEEIAFMTGYETGKAFEKAFKKQFGYTPAYLRRSST